MPVGRVDGRELRREGRAGKGDPGILVEGLRRSDDRRSRRRDGRGTAEPVFHLRRQAGDILGVLKAYAERKGASAAKALLSPQGLRDSIAAFLRYAVESATEKGSAPGCLLVCVAPLVNDAEVRRFLQKAAAGGVARWKVVSGTGSLPEKSRPTFLWPCARSKSRILLVA